MNWSTATLGELADFRNGLNYTKDNFGAGLRIISVKDFGDRSEPDYDSLDEINPHGVLRDEALLQKGDVLFVRSNGNPDLIGRSLYIGDAPGEVSFSAFCIRARINPEYNPRFFAYFFRSPQFRKLLSSHGSGTNIKNLNQDILGRMRVPTPERELQDRIVELLSSYDNLIGNNQRRIEVLEQCARLLFREWFVLLHYPGHEHDKVVGGIPEGWETKRIEEVADTIGGGTPSSGVSKFWDNGDITWFVPSDITKNDCLILLESERKITEAGLRESSARMLPRGAILMTSRASVGYFGLHDEGNCCTNQGFISVVPQIPLARFFILHNLMCRKEEIISKAGGTTYKEINKTTFRNLTITIPREQVRREFEEVCSILFAQVRILKKQSVNAEKARDLLLPRLMDGRISV